MLEIDGRSLTLEQIAAVSRGELQVSIGWNARAKMADARHVIERIVIEGKAVYGVSTGFGKLSDVHIPGSRLAELQANLVRSHACGVGEPLAEPEVRALILLRANVLAMGCSGTRAEIADALVGMLNKGVVPVVPSRGSVGASGDLAPLAHLALVVMGEGEAFYRGERMPGGRAMQSAAVNPVPLEAKEGLSLLNGTQAMVAVGGLALLRAIRLAAYADVSGAMTLEALLGTPVAFDARIHDARPHPGQTTSARRLRTLLEGSEIRDSHLEDDPRVQDAYSLRCMPQVHGAVRGALDHARSVLEIESGSATDNPLVFSEEAEVLSGGNFHGAPLAYAFDYAAIVLTDLISIVERRIDRMVNPDLNEHLPAFLSEDPGMRSGFMIPHVVAVALLAEAKVLAHPASVDNAPTSGGKEDHVSMGMTSALKLRQIVELAERVLAIELLAAAEGLEYRKPLKPGVGVQAAYEAVRARVPRLGADRSMSGDIEKLAAAICGLSPDAPPK